MKNLIILFFCYLVVNETLAQVPENPSFANSKAEIDTVYGQDGRAFALQDLLVNVDGKYGNNNVIASTNSCSAGYFNVYFATNSGMTGTTTVEAQRRAVICEVLANISGMVSPSFNLANDKVNILIADLAQYVNNPNTSVTLGVFTPFVAFPSVLQNSSPGILDNLIYKTIISQQDAYNSIAVPPMQLSSPTASAQFYHGMMALNFYNPGITFNSDMTVGPAWNEYDLYSVVLHEMTHALGFTSFINGDGNSVYGPTKNYFSRYDRFLKDINGSPMISTSSTCSNLYGYAFSSNTLHLSPSCPNPTNFPQNNTNCGTANYYSSFNIPYIPVYTPDCYTPGSSLSHFEDQCYPLVGPVYGNDAYFSMSNGAAFGVTKRFLKEEERLVLCDIGYTVTNTYTSNATNANKTYTSGACSSPLIAGINDGVSMFGNTATYLINTSILTPVTISNILTNDINAASYKCLETVIGSGTLSNTFGSGSFNYTPANSGLHLLRYVPVDANNHEGGITYIYVKVAIPTGTCSNPPNSPCSLIFNGDFEEFNTLPLHLNDGLNPPVYPCGWSASHGSPEYYQGLGPGISPVGVPCNNFGYETDNIPGNKAYCGLLTQPAQNGFQSESIYTQLNSPLQPNTAYTLRFDVSLSDGYNNLSLPLQAYLAPTNGFTTTSFFGINAVAGSTILLTTPTTFTTTNGWTQVTLNFTTGAIAGQQYLALGNLFGVPMTTIQPAPLVNNCFYTTIQSFGSALAAYHYIDNVALFPSNYTATLNLPPTLCSNETINLAPLANPAGGIFTGNGVVCTGTNCVFDASLVNSGNATISYSVSVASATCPYNGAGFVNILTPLSITATQVNTICTPGQTTTLTASSSQTLPMTYTWQPGNLVAQTIAVTPTANTIYTVTGSNGQCTNTQVVSVNFPPPITFTNLPTHLCSGYQWIYLSNCLAPGSPTNGVWLSSGPPQVGVTGLWIAGNAQAFAQPTQAAGIYTATYVYTAPSSCSSSAQFTVNVINTPTPSTNGPLSMCTNIQGYSVTLQAGSTSTLPMTYTWMPGGVVSPSYVVSPSVSVNYSLSASDGSCVSQQPALAEVSTRTNCCGGTSSGASWQYLTDATIGTTTLSGLYAINQNLIITGDVSLDGEFYFAPNVAVKILNGGYLNSDAPNIFGGAGGAHLLSCGEMWNGIQVDSWARVKFKNGDLIEDAKIAIDRSASIFTFTPWWIPYEIDLEGVVFNRNRVGVAIRSYTEIPVTTPPFKISACVFTNRLLPSTSLSVSTISSWQNYASLTSTSSPSSATGSPYQMGNFTPANLKAPYSNEPANTGVYVENSGLTTNPTTTNTVYHHVYVGNASNQYALPTYFDNLNTGISSLNSNVSSQNNIFQNSRDITSGPIWLDGVGIRGVNDNSNILNYNTSIHMVGSFNPSTNNNKFYDCYTAVRLKNVFQLNMGYAEIYSTQSKLNSTQTYGQYGVFIESNIFKNYRIEYSKFVNVAIGVILVSNTGWHNVTGTFGYGQVWGTINIRNNFFSSALSYGANPGNGFMSFGVVAQNVLASKSQVLGANIFTIAPNNGLWVSNNTFDQVYRGVAIYNFANSAFGKYATNNLINLVQDHLPQPMWGVNYLNDYFGVVNSNTITGFSSSASNSLTGINYAQNKNSRMECNYLNRLAKGAEFGGNNSVVVWKGNIMQNNARGMQLSNNGIIGSQGTANSPSDNYWGGSWPLGVYHTYVTSSSPNLSVITKRNSPVQYNPTNNGGNPGYGPGSLLNGSSPTLPLCVIGLPTKGPYGTKTPISTAIVHFGANDYFGNHPYGTYEVNRILLFEDLKEDDSLRTSAAVLQAFYDSNEAGDIGTLSDIEDKLTMGEFTLANTLLADFYPSNTVHANYKRFYELFSKYNNPSETFDENDQVDLNVLAHKCPFIDGAIVYNARTLYFGVTGVLDVYNDENCDREEDDGNGRMAFYENGEEKNKELSIGETDNYQLFPNPASDKLYILGKSAREDLTLEIYDVNNRLISKTDLSLNNYTADLKLNLINGVYFVTLINKNNKEKIVKKLVISK
jgi:hypothetical protein